MKYPSAFCWGVLGWNPGHVAVEEKNYVGIAGTLVGAEPKPFRSDMRTWKTYVATARIVLPGSSIRLAAGRHLFTESEQAMAFLAGANAIFTGERMLTTPTSSWDEDKAMLGRWGLRGMGSFEDKTMAPHSSATPSATATSEAVSVEDRRAKAKASEAFQTA